jgi:hypothetical protein
MKKISYTLNFLSQANIQHRLEFVEDDPASQSAYWQLVKDDCIIDMSVDATDIIISAVEEQNSLESQALAINGDFIDDRQESRLFNKIKS